MLAGQHSLEPFLDKLLARSGDDCQAGIERRSDLAVTQCFTALRGIRLQQDACFHQLCARCLPVRIKLSSCSRSAALSFTTYSFKAVSLAATNWLRQNVILRQISDSLTPQ